MLPTFVIGLREGLEAALIVGIIAAFLRKQGRTEVLRWVLVGVAAAVLLCVTIGATLEIVSRNLPQRQQEGLETVIGLLAVGMLTYMIAWMRRHSRGLKGELEGLAADALHGNSGRAMVVMAFLAVLREGFETVVFLIAAFNESGSGGAAFGAVFGIVVAVGLGYGIYRGGVRLNLSKFFRATGLVLVVVAAGLVVSALHTAHEAGWLNVGQGATIDLTWLVQPGSVQSSLLTGVLGIQPHPVVIETIGWLAYLIPVGLFVAWPAGRSIPRRTLALAGAVTAAVAAIATVTLVVLIPAQPASRPSTSGYALAGKQLIRTPDGEVTVRPAGSAEYRGVATDVYTASLPGTAATGRPERIDLTEVAALNNGRLPLGLRSSTSKVDSVAVRYTDTTTLTVWVEPRTQRVVDVRQTETVRATAVDTPVGSVPLPKPISTTTESLPGNGLAAARHDLNTLDRRDNLQTAAWTLGVVAVLALLGSAMAALGRERSQEAAPTSAGAPVALVRS
jgi:high-affinity iron transporter